MPPAIAAIAMSPTTTPAAIPALLAPCEAEEEAEELGVIVTVCPPMVTTDWGTDDVLEADDPELAVDVDPSALTLVTVPSKSSLVR